MSAFKQQFVAVIRCQGSILREHDGVVTLPFGTEYEIVLKNLNSRRALAKVQIDGKDIVNGGFIIEPGQDFPIERFVESNDKGNRFKFIQKTKKIMEHRGDRLDDGMIRVEFWFEKPKAVTITTTHVTRHENHWIYPYEYPRKFWYTTSSGDSGCSTFTCNSDTVYSAAPLSNTVSCACSINSVTDAVTSEGDPAKVVKRAIDPQVNAEEGITVKGSESYQKFTNGHIGVLEENSEVIILRLVGTTSSGQNVEQPVTVKAKLTCPTCGTSNPSGNKFCAECGTYLW